MEEEVILELNEKTDLIAVDCECPICGDKYLSGVPYVHVPCKCGATYKTDFKQDIYTKKARQLLSKISHNNRTKLRISEKYESAGFYIQQHFKLQNCWNVSPLTQVKEEYKRCRSCGVCFNCLTCKNCGHAFERDKNRRKQICPHCRSDTFTKTYFDEVFVAEKNKNIRLCPHCKSDKIRMTRTRNKTKCHLCNSKKLSEQKSDIIFILVIERKKAYRIENVPRD